MTKQGKRMAQALADVDSEAEYKVQEAIQLVKQTATAKFDETVELHIKTCLLYTSDAADE